MVVIIAITEMVALVSAGVLGFVTLLMLIMTWTRIITSYVNLTSPFVWLSVGIVLLTPICLVFLASISAIYGASANVPLPSQLDFLLLNTIPPWWLLSLVGWLVLLLPPERRALTSKAFVAAALLYGATLLSAPSLLKVVAANGYSVQPIDLSSTVILWGYIANPFIALALFLAAFFRLSKRIAISLLGIVLVFSSIATILIAVVPFHD